MTLALALLSSCIATSSPLPAGTVILGVSTIDGTHTDIVAVAPSGEREVLGELEHARGRIPKGTFDQITGRIVTVAVVDDGVGTVVEETLIATGARSVVDSNAIAIQAPHTAVLIREPTEGHFEVVRDHQVTSTFDGAWLMYVGQREFFAVDADGTNELLVDQGDSLQALKPNFGKGRFRSPVVGEIVEHDIDASHAEIVTIDKRVLYRGLPGMDPIRVGFNRIALGGGTKHATILLGRFGHDGLEKVVLDAHMAGVATPLAAATVDEWGDEAVVVAWIDRGASLPGELVRFDELSGRVDVIAGPEVHAAYEVYGVVEGDLRVIP
jgi:hypothetical protein